MVARDSSTTLAVLLSDRGYRLTTPRRQVLDVLTASAAPLTAAEIHQRLDDRRINLASVYRTIALLSRVDVLRATDSIGLKQRFELADAAGDHHHHLICQRCGRIEDLEECPLEATALRAVNRRLRRSRRFRVMQHELRLIGACRDCSERPAGSRRRRS
jgi:Fur family ferric uptake transcriptional regulator